MSKSNKVPFPDRVYPLGIAFQVQVVDQVDDDLSDGETNGSSRIIKIGAHQYTRRRWTTLWHEYIHATFEVTGIGSVLDDEMEEIIACSLEHAFEQFILSHGTEVLKALEVQK